MGKRRAIWVSEISVTASRRVAKIRATHTRSGVVRFRSFSFSVSSERKPPFIDFFAVRRLPGNEIFISFEGVFDVFVYHQCFLYQRVDTTC